MPRKCIHRGLLTLTGISLIGFTLQIFSYMQLALRTGQAGLHVATETRASGGPIANLTGSPPRKKYHILINSYMSSGSRFTAQLFGFRHDAFYFYEPLWRFSIWDYFHEPDLVCSSLKGSGNCHSLIQWESQTNLVRDETPSHSASHLAPNCLQRKRTAAQVNHIYQRGTPGNKIHLVPNVTDAMFVTEMVEDVLYHVYQCDFDKIKNLIVKGVQDHPELAGEGWSAYRICILRKMSQDHCLRKQEELCRKANHVVTKVLRLTTISLRSLMSRIPDLKVLQLFRDPRAIVNSRLESRGYPTNDVTLNSAALCNKMYMDYTGGVELMKTFPGRFRFMFYEDIKDNLREKMKELYEFVGMELDDKELDRLNTVKTNAAISRTPMTLKTRISDNANWWKGHMSFARYQSVMDQCKELVPIFNMTKFNDIKELNQFSVPALHLPDDLRIKVS